MAEKKIKFQEAMKRLDEIIAKLNSGDLELEDAMDLFEEGITLTNQCEKQLKEFENKMDQLMAVRESNNE
ncbi:MAG: exodeoxyribonuclease VII small subunit [Faecalicoccus sp.]|nr:exodeoxyribonuclease VII small subunit [Faecalicoccus sp.]